MQMKLVLIEWVDSYGCSPNWEDLTETANPEPMMCRSVGWLLHDGSGCKVIVPHVADVTNDSQQGCGNMAIPTACIVRTADLIERVHRPRG